MKILFMAISLMASAASAQDVRTYIPAAAEAQRATLQSEWLANWPDHPMPQLLPALAEHESCITLKHSRCWSPTSKLKTKREEGAGISMLTRAWYPDGRLRFDALTEMRNRNPALHELSWANVYQRPDLQIRALVLKVRGDYMGLRLVSDPLQRLAFADAAYNGGMGGVNKERRACGLKSGCDPQRWWGNVEATCMKSKAPLYGGRSACDINRHHVVDVLKVRSPKYRGWL